MPRYALQLAYKGTQYAGWQIQENATTVQARVQHALSVIIGDEISVVGCGRTDTGVHASNYIAHFDTESSFPNNLIYRLSRFLPHDIGIYNIVETEESFHARFSAQMRTYKYLLDFEPSIFMKDLYYFCPYINKLDTNRMQSAAKILLDYEAFFPFCKSKAQVDHYKCKMMHSQWEQINDTRWIYTVKANRFLRGMVRMIVGMCLNVGRGKLKESTVRDCLDQQKRLSNPWSAPAEGLYLYDIEYDQQTFTKASTSPLFFPI